MPVTRHGAAGTGSVARAVPWVSVVLPFALLLALADEFWVVALRTGVGSIERTAAPAVSWLRESVELLPVYVVAVVAALALAHRRWGDVPRGRGPVLGTVVLVAVGATLAGGGVLLASSLWDYHLQALELVHHSEVHTECVGTCLESAQRASLDIQLKAVAVGLPILAVTNLLLVGWTVALRGRPITTAAYQRRGSGRDGVDERVVALVLVLVGSALVHTAVVPEHLEEWVVSGGFFAVVVGVQLAVAVWVWKRPGPVALTVSALGSAALIALWAVSRIVGVPVGPEAWEPEPVGLADLCAGALELAAVGLCLVLLRAGRGRPASRGARSAHARGIAVAGIVALTVLGIGGSALPGVDLLTGSGGHSADESAGEPAD